MSPFSAKLKELPALSQLTPFLAEIGHLGCDWKSLYERCIGGDFGGNGYSGWSEGECVSVDVTFVLRLEQ